MPGMGYKCTNNASLADLSHVLVFVALNIIPKTLFSQSGLHPHAIPLN